MNNEYFAKKLAGYIGTTTAITVGTVGFLTAGSYCIPNYSPKISYQIDMSRFKLTNPYEIRITLQSEENIEPNNPPIHINVASKMVFRFGQPEQKKFSI